MRVAVVGNRGDDDEGLVGARLVYHGASFVHYERESPDALQRCEQLCDLLVLLGSDWSVYDETRGGLIAAEQALVRRAQLRGTPILGICFGGQLISSAIGLSVTRTAVPEIGWRTLETDDPLLCPVGPWFQYHFDRWSDAGEVHSIARTPGGPQAYWYGRALALQFHPEVTPAIVERWLADGRQTVEGIGEQVDKIVAETHQFAQDAEDRCNVFVDQFLEHADRSIYPESVF